MRLSSTLYQAIVVMKPPEIYGRPLWIILRSSLGISNLHYLQYNLTLCFYLVAVRLMLRLEVEVLMCWSKEYLAMRMLAFKIFGRDLQNCHT